jgi:predicted AlkP superfamily pyrophosphatase or phosphodiesterase
MKKMLLMMTALLQLCCASAVLARPVTVLVSIDGFRPDYRNQGNTPNLDALAAQGVVGTMQPSFPSVTFPNHWTLVTGLRPDRHGIVNGTMSDPAHPGVIFGKSSEQPWWWDAAEPVWVAAEKAGIKSGIMFWPGSTVAIDGRRASSWQAYHTEVTNAMRAQTVLDYMRRPVAQRPGLVLVYFGDVDVMGHRHGPGSAQVVAAIRDVDKAIGTIRRGIAAMGRRINLVVVSDHGMARTDPARVVWAKDYVKKSDYQLVSYGGIWFINNVPGHEAALADALKSLPPYIHCWPKGAMPERFHYGTNPRVADWMCLPDAGARIMDGSPDHPDDGGDHGYDPASPDMTALFLAEGPAFRGHTAMAKFDNVNIEPLLRRLIGLAPRVGADGSAEVFAKVLK